MNIPKENQNVVEQKSRTAVKVLADKVGLQYSKVLQNRQQSHMTEHQKSEDLLTRVAEAIGKKYQFARLKQQQQQSQMQSQIRGSHMFVKTSYVVNSQAPIKQTQGTVVNQREYTQGIRNSHVVSENRHQPIVKTNVSEQIRGSHVNSRKSHNNKISINQEQAVFQENIHEKQFDVVIEKPVVKEIVVEKPYEVIVEKPVENRIIKNVVIEKYIDNPVERVIE